MIEMLKAAPMRPRLCIVGEPTGMQVATGHKGKVALRAVCTGREGHSALAPMALNALHLAVDFVNAVRVLQADVAANGLRDGDYDVPYSTLHVGKLNGGVQVNIVPNTAVVDFEIRSLAGEDVLGLIERLREARRRSGRWRPRSGTSVCSCGPARPGAATPTPCEAGWRAARRSRRRCVRAPRAPGRMPRSPPRSPPCRTAAATRRRTGNKG